MFAPVSLNTRTQSELNANPYGPALLEDGIIGALATPLYPIV